MDSERLFPVPAARETPQHYALLLRACGLSYGLLETRERVRLGRLASRMSRNGIAERRIIEAADRLRTVLGRDPTPGEVANRLLG